MNDLKRKVKRVLSLLAAAAIVMASVFQEPFYASAAGAEIIVEDFRVEEDAGKKSGSEGLEAEETDGTEQGSGDSDTEETSGTEQGSEDLDTEETDGTQQDSGDIETEDTTGTEPDLEDSDTEEVSGTEAGSENLEEESEEIEDSIYGEAERPQYETTASEGTEEQEDKDGIIASGTSGYKDSDVTWTLYENGELVVEGTGEFTNGAGAFHPWYDYSDMIESATVKVTGASHASYMFSECSNLKKVDLKDFDTTNVTGMMGMFENCTSLTEIDLSGLHTENVTNMISMFSGCSSLETLDLSSFHTENVIHMDSMFSGCSSLKTLI